MLHFSDENNSTFHEQTGSLDHFWTKSSAQAPGLSGGFYPPDDAIDKSYSPASGGPPEVTRRQLVAAGAPLLCEQGFELGLADADPVSP